MTAWPSDWQPKIQNLYEITTDPGHWGAIISAGGRADLVQQWFSENMPNGSWFVVPDAGTDLVYVHLLEQDAIELRLIFPHS